MIFIVYTIIHQLSYCNGEKMDENLSTKLYLIWSPNIIASQYKKLGLSKQSKDDNLLQKKRKFIITYLAFDLRFTASILSELEVKLLSTLSVKPTELGMITKLIKSSKYKPKMSERIPVLEGETLTSSIRV